MRNNTFVEIKNGDANFWKDDWLGTGCLSVKYDEELGNNSKVLVRDLIDNEAWNLDSLQGILLQDDINEIESKDVTLSNEADDWIWQNDTLGKFSLKSAFNHLRKRQESSQQCTYIWDKRLQLKISIFMWRLHNSVYSEETLHRHSLETLFLCLTFKEKLLRVDDSDERWDDDSEGWDVVLKDFLRTIVVSVYPGIEELGRMLGSDLTLQTRSSSRTDGKQLLDSVDFILHSLQSLESRSPGANETVTFMKNFIRFATLHGLEDRQIIGDLLTHFERVFIQSAVLLFDVCIERYLSSNSHRELMRKIEPVESRVFEIYVGVLQDVSKFSGSSFHPTKETHALVFRDFVDSLIFLILNLFFRDCIFVDMFHHEMHKVHEGLSFLRTTLSEQHDKLDDLIRPLICEAGILIFHLYQVSSEKDKFQALHDDLTVLRSFVVLDNGMTIQDLSELRGSEIELIKTRVSEIPWSMEPTIAVQKISQANLKMAPAVGKIPDSHERVVGLDDEAKIIIDRLARGTKQLDVVSIVGMAGLGKTSLAKKVYHHPHISRHFQVRSWLTVSQEYNTKSLLIGILSGLDQNSTGAYINMREDDLAERLRKRLKGIRYLIILDDIWDTQVWNSLTMSFPDDDKGSRILLTSRQVTKINPHSEPHRLRALNYFGRRCALTKVVHRKK
ncbi:OLC1v1012230C1 [Oldenlandia corymbosa var. corymbosa]|uniref:OLC1v1012230C1 n=1 Tax=Oldenlandia corymbosa var. corymbosa TaxID=529605 RepID=A0AAV1DVL9_OLDCO|nr:OLC1v1012230C1 [Oldenlandia corymbosa var. corymbosa]